MFHRLLLLGALITLPVAMNAQDFGLPMPDHKPVYDIAPQYPEGSQAIMRYFADSARYPEPERSTHKQGHVLAAFTVDKKGRVTDVRIVNGVPGAPNLAAEARRLLEAMPRWQPATLKGRRVAAEVQLAIPFRIADAQ